MATLPQRQKEYESFCDQKILPRVPVIAVVNGRSFSNVTKNIQKPFCHKTIAIMNDTMLSIMKEIEGVVFGFQYSDKIILVIKNDQSKNTDPWFGNNVQKLCSAITSHVTFEFMSKFYNMESPPDLRGSLVFTTELFPVPNVDEAVNYIIYKQYECIKYAINEAAYSLLRARYGEDTHSILEDKNSEERKEILNDIGVNFDEFPNAYRHGVAAYLIPKFVNTSHGQIQKHKWVLDFEIPLFVNARDRLKTIIGTGSDIFRPNRDLTNAV